VLHALNIYDPRERALVMVADALSAAVRPLVRAATHRASAGQPRRILLLRLERIGDLLMTFGALDVIHATWPAAQVDLVVGSWNLAVARTLTWPHDVQVIDAPWLVRGRGGRAWSRLLGAAWRWRRARYDLAINFEGDIRSNALMALSGAPVRVGFSMAGGGPLLTDIVAHDPTQHTDENTRRLARSAARRFDVGAREVPPSWPRLAVPQRARLAADRLLEDPAGRSDRPLIGVHASGGRAIKQWHPDRFGQAVGRLATELGARVVLTGSPEDRSLVDAVRDALPRQVDTVDLTGRVDLLELAAVLSRLALYVSGDTGPMHLAAAMGTPLVAVFGLSDPARYAPLAPHRRIVRIDLPCSPCNRVRKPPARCVGHVPDCLEGISAETVYRAGIDLLRETAALRPVPDAGRERA
jgi:lipopolysaccharide heptosyltransferase II